MYWGKDGYFEANKQINKIVLDVITAKCGSTDCPQLYIQAGPQYTHALWYSLPTKAFPHRSKCHLSGIPGVVSEGSRQG